uniref:Uncharacterized protein n=1 Tax=Aegilops tauschii subsp. strangulata TaxID=200361 RepID=A0A453F1A9_AEGTS
YVLRKMRWHQVRTHVGCPTNGVGAVVNLRRETARTDAERVEWTSQSSATAPLNLAAVAARKRKRYAPSSRPTAAVEESK